METKAERLDEGNEGLGNVEAATQNLPQSCVEYGNGGPKENLKSATQQTGSEPSGEIQSTESYDHLPPELRPVDGKFPELNEALMRRLRGKYFTVKHPRLAACDHKMDLMNEPRTNCQDCWINFFAYHPKLVEVADEMYRSKGKEAVIGLRGKKFVRFFGRFMATLIREKDLHEDREAKERVRQEEMAGETPSPEGSVRELQPTPTV